MGGFKSQFDRQSSPIKLKSDRTRFFGKENWPKSTGTVLPMSLKPNSGASEATLSTLPVQSASPTSAKSVCSTARLPILAKSLKSKSIANMCVCFEKECRCTMGKKHQVRNVEMASRMKYVDFGKYEKSAPRTESKISLSESKESSIFDAADGLESNPGASESVSTTSSGVAHFFNGVHDAFKSVAQKTYCFKLKVQFTFDRWKNSRWFRRHRNQRYMTPPSAAFLDIHEYLNRNQYDKKGKRKTSSSSMKMAMDRKKTRVSKKQAKANLLPRSELRSLHSGDRVVVRDSMTEAHQKLERLKPVAFKTIARHKTREESFDGKLSGLIALDAHRESAIRSDRSKRRSDIRPSSSKKVSMPSSSLPQKRDPLPKKVEQKAERSSVSATRTGTDEVIEAVDNYAKEMGLSLSPKSTLILRGKGEPPLRIRSKHASPAVACDNSKKATAKSTRKNPHAELRFTYERFTIEDGRLTEFEQHAGTFTFARLLQSRPQSLHGVVAEIADSCTGAEPVERKLVKAELVKSRPQSLHGVVAEIADSRTGAELVERKLVKGELVKSRRQSVAEIADSRTGTELVERKLVKAELVKPRPQSLIDAVAKAIDSDVETAHSRSDFGLLERKPVKAELLKPRPQSLIDAVAEDIDSDVETADSRSSFEMVERDLFKNEQFKAGPHGITDTVSLGARFAAAFRARKAKAQPQSLIDVAAKAIDADEAPGTRCELVCRESQRPGEPDSTRLTSMEVSNVENCQRERLASLRSSIGSFISSKNGKTQSLQHSGKAGVTEAQSSSKSSKKGTLRALKDEDSTGVAGDLDEEQLDSEDDDDRFPKLKVKVVDYESGTVNWKKYLRNISVPRKSPKTSRMPAKRFEGKVRELAQCFEGIGTEDGTPQKPRVK